MEPEKEMIRMVDDQTIEVSLPNKLGYERVAMDCSAAFAKLAGFVPEKIDDLRTAVSEACMNAIEHGNKDRPDARVMVTISYDGENFQVEVVDQGEGIAQMPKDPDIDQKVQELETPRGLGLYLIKQLMDQVEFNEKTEKGHTVRMIIKMKDEPKDGTDAD